MARLSISRTSVYNLMRRGELPWIQVGAHRRFEESALERFERQQRRGGA
jgi:excisionase family DNA binding protein